LRIGLFIDNLRWPGGPVRFGATLSKVAQASHDRGFDLIAVPAQHPFHVTGLERRPHGDGVLTIPLRDVLPHSKRRK
jgi:hypothetical protein